MRLGGSSVIRNCSFLSNSASDRGTAVAVVGSASVSGSSFDGNELSCAAGSYRNDMEVNEDGLWICRHTFRRRECFAVPSAASCHTFNHLKKNGVFSRLPRANQPIHTVLFEAESLPAVYRSPPALLPLVCMRWN